MPDKVITSLFLAFFATFCIVVMWPGVIYWDTFVQYREALSGSYTDWHPPILSFFWRQLILTTGQTGSLIAINIVMLCIAFYFLTKDLKWFISVPLLFITLANPVFFGNIGIPWKDVTLAVIVLLAASLAIHSSFNNRKLSRTTVSLLLTCLLFASFLRANAPFITAPVAVMLLSTWRPISLSPVVSGVLALALIIITPIVNNTLLGAKKSHAIQSLQIFDIGGVSNNINENLFPGFFNEIETDKIKKNCYTPYLWNDYAWGGCSFVYEKVNRDALPISWKKAIFDNPLAYFRHRITYFNNFIRFFGPFYPDWYYMPKLPGIESEAAIKPNLIMQAYIDFEKDNPRQPWFIPYIWLSFAIGFFIATFKHTGDKLNATLHAVSFAAIVYILGYAAVGVASDLRYVFPSAYLVVACLFATVLGWTRIGTPKSRIIGILTTVVIVIVGLVF